MLDSSASHHMASSRDDLASLEPCTTSTISMGDNTPFEVYGRGSIDMDDGTFQNVICVPSLSTNLLSIYQITHSGSGRRVEFTPDSMVISEMTNGVLKICSQDSICCFTHSFR